MGRQITESQALWAIIAVMIGVDALWAWSLGVRVYLSAWVVGIFCFMACLNLAYVTIRKNHLVTAFSTAFAQMIAFGSAVLLLNYLGAMSRFPLIDRYLVRAENALGIDWLSLFAWVQDHAVVGHLLELAYSSFTIQIFILIMLLPGLGRIERLREFVWLFVITAMITITTSWFLPAEGAWAYYKVSHLTSGYYIQDFNDLRMGKMTEIFMDRITGIVQFPSFHAATALIFIYTSRGIRVLFPLSLSLNVLMIASTPVYGGHHFADVLGGLAVVPLAIFILRSWQREPSELLRLRRSSPSQ